MRWLALALVAGSLGCAKDEDSSGVTQPAGIATGSGTGTGTGAATGTGTGGGTGSGTGTGTGAGTGTGTGAGTGTGTGTGSSGTFDCGTESCDIGDTCHTYIGASTTYICAPPSASCYGFSTCDCILCEQPGAGVQTCTDLPGEGALCTWYL